MGLLFVPSPRAEDRIGAASPGLIETGIPAYTVFSNESLGLGSPPLDILTLSDGRTLIVGSTELVVGDGSRWELITRAPGETRLISGRLCMDKLGRLYTSLPDGFASISFDEEGRWFFKEERTISQGEGGQWPALLANLEIDGQRYWYGNGMVKWTPGLDAETRVVARGIGVEHIFTLHGLLYASDFSTGVIRAFNRDGSNYEAVPAHLTDGNASVISSAYFDEDALLVGTVQSGLRLFDGSTLKPFAQQGPLSGGARISDLCRTRAGFYAAAIDGYGVVFFDRSGRILQTLSHSVDNRFAQVKRLHAESSGGVWTLTSRGIAHVDFPSRISYYDGLLGSGSDYVEPVRHEGRLWLLATGKILQAHYDEAGRLTGFSKNTPDEVFCYTLVSLDGGLLCSSSKGFYELSESGWTRISPDIVNARVLGATSGSEEWVYCAKGELGTMKRSANGRWTFARTWQSDLGNSYNSLRDGKGVFWLELGPSTVARVDPSARPLKARILREEDGLPGGWAELFLVDGLVRLNSSGRTLVFDEASQRFKVDESLRERYPELINTIGGRPTRDAGGRLWIPKMDVLRIVDDSQGPALRRVESLPADLKPGKLLCAPDGVVWMQERLRFARYDPSMPEPLRLIPKALVTKLELPASGRVLLSPAEATTRLSYADNTLIAHFVALHVPIGTNVTFEMLIEGLGDQWVNTGPVGSALLNRLKEGTYTLRVRPVFSGTQGEAAIVHLVIQPPWYRSTAAYFTYAFLLLVSLSLGILLPVRISRTHKLMLEQQVAERTRELYASQENFRQLNAELERRVEDRTLELRQRIEQVEHLYHDLDTAAARLTEANRELESFSYSVSHDLRAPLRNITGFLQLLERKVRAKGEKEYDHHLEVIATEATRMGSLIDSLLALSRITRADLHFGPVDLALLVEEGRRQLALETSGRQIEWLISRPPSVQGDKGLLQQLVANLLGNAVKFTRKTTVARIEFGFSTLSESPGFLHLFLRDNGAGFDPKYTDRLFGVFQRLHSAKDFEGTGIGLANVKRIVSRHGGTIWAEGSPGMGACFHFTLPLSNPVDDKAGLRQNAQSKA